MKKNKAHAADGRAIRTRTPRMKRHLALATSLLTVVPMIAIAFSAAVAPSPAHAERCGYWTPGRIAIIDRSTKNLSSVASKFNSNRTESSTLNVGVTTTRSDSSTVSAGYTASLGNVIASVEARFDVSVTRSVDKSESITNEMRVMPRRYGRTVRQTVRTKFENYSFFLHPRTCKRIERKVNWRANLITSNPHFAECQDRRNLCTPR